MEEKYAELLLKKCLDLQHSNYLYIHYPKEASSFVEKLESFAQEMLIRVEKEIDDPEAIVKELEKTPKEEIEQNRMFSRDSWNEAAKDGAAFLFLETVSKDYFQGVDTSKFEELMRVRRNSKPVYDEKRDNKELSWCIAAYPSEYWAKRLFPKDVDAYLKLKNLIFKVCMIDKEDPIAAWEEELELSKRKADYLNSLHISKLHYHNSLGTDFTVELPLNYQFCSASETNVYGVQTIVNMPSYEVFTSPDYRTTKGVIHSSKPLFYQGRKIDDFTLTFEEGKVVQLSAKEGLEILEGIVYGEEKSSYLGEVALVDYHSPISNTGCVFETTLLDENAACHVALGSGFSEALVNGEKMSVEERVRCGVNQAKTHIDFMIGTVDLKITALTNDNREISIFENGDFVWNL